ncbi:Protein of unknown function [Natronincola peptidivorans]|uniref:DUF1292 domain-containing protein n=1 Tax=Natronincola peptidivorans TaxID=426128 RepID=A0A1I0AUQ6_9FIRM|nr:DUF1292 domain-containing protein [Natronincola peptidivorans]SES98110.1 Protein of unknown function [Natronincola peptidivorans]
MGNCMDQCGCNHEGHTNEGHKKIYLTLMDNSQLECDVLNVFDANDKKYIAVLPEDSESAMLYGFVETAEGPQLNNIESDEEYQIASKAFLEAHHTFSK